MANTPGEDFGQALALFIQIVFSPIFPLLAITLCGVSFLLTFVFGLPQFALMASLSIAAFEYCRGHFWAMAALVFFILAALPLAWVGFKEAETRTSRVIGHWVACAIVGGGILWLASAWPFSGSGFQQIVFAILLFAVWTDVCQTAMITAKLVALSRPQPGPEVVEAQKAHGDATVASDAEAVSLLNFKK
jgi:hypothetical protein